MIVYAIVASQISVSAIFLAGVVPGIVVGLAIMLVCRLIGADGAEEESERPKFDFPTVLKTGAAALPSLLLLVIVLAGILGGAFSATEAAAIAVLYAFILAVIIYREVPLGNLPRILLQTGITTSIIFMLIGTSQALSWVMTWQNIPQTVSVMMLSVSDNPVVILLMINLLLLFVGTFMDMTPAVLIFTPILLPVVQKMGVDPIHFGIMMIVNLCIGLCTPPVGTCLFIGCGVGKTSIAKVTKPMLPFFAAMIVALMFITYVPALSLWLPRAMGQME